MPEPVALPGIVAKKGGENTLPPIYYGLVTLAVLLAHSIMVLRELVWDDVKHLEQLDSTGFWRPLDLDPFGFIRPGKVLLFSLYHSLFGTNSYAWQSVSLAVLVATCLLLLRFLSLWVAPLPALLGALIYAVHPLHVEGVGWASASNGTWLTMFALLYYLTLALPRWRTHVLVWPLSTLLIVLGMVMKEEAITFPVVAAFTLYYINVPLQRRFAVLLLFHLIVAACIVGLFRFYSVRAGQELLTLPPLPKWMISTSVFRVMLSHLLYFIWPYQWGYYQGYDYRLWPYIGLAVASIAVAILISFGLWKRRGQRLPGDFGVIFYAIAILPMSNLVPLGNDHHGARYLSHSGVGIVILLSWILNQVLQDRSGLWAKFTVASWLLASILASNYYHYQWRSTEVLFRNLTAHSNQWVFPSNYASWLHHGGKSEEALQIIPKAYLSLEHAEKTRRASHKMARNAKVELLVLEGQIRFRRGEAALAKALFEDARKLKPEDPQTLINLASLYDHMYGQSRDRRHFTSAVQYYTSATGGLKGTSVAYANLAVLFAQEGQTTTAVRILQDGISKYPADKTLRHNLRVALQELKQRAN